MTEYYCPICGGEMKNSNFSNVKFCMDCEVDIDITILDAIEKNKTALICEHMDAMTEMCAQYDDDCHAFQEKIWNLEKELETQKKINDCLSTAASFAAIPKM